MPFRLVNAKPVLSPHKSLPLQNVGDRVQPLRKFIIQNGKSIQKFAENVVLQPVRVPVKSQKPITSSTATKASTSKPPESNSLPAKGDTSRTASTAPSKEIHKPNPLLANGNEAQKSRKLISYSSSANLEIESPGGAAVQSSSKKSPVGLPSKIPVLVTSPKEAVTGAYAGIDMTLKEKFDAAIQIQTPSLNKKNKKQPKTIEGGDEPATRNDVAAVHKDLLYVKRVMLKIEKTLNPNAKRSSFDPTEHDFNIPLSNTEDVQNCEIFFKYLC